MPMKDPPHPGHTIKDACLDPLNLSLIDRHAVTEARARGW
jgi:hypothetical protein